MRRAPAEFATEVNLPRRRVRQLAQVQLLLNDERYLAARGLAVDDRFRLELLHDVARTIEMLHGLGVVVGDLSPTNLLFSRERRPRCFFLDCDAMLLRGASALDQAETTDWQAPDERIATPATDSYKFALLCVRLFAGHQSARDAAAVDRAGWALRNLVARGLSPDPRQRPSMTQWREVLATVGTPPRRSVRPLPTVAAVIAVVLLIAIVLSVRGCAGWARGVGTSVGAGEQATGVARVLSLSGRSRDQLDAALAGVVSCAGPGAAVVSLRSVEAQRRTQIERTAGLHVNRLPRGTELRVRIGAALEQARRAANSYAAWAAGVDRAGCGSAAMRNADRGRGDAATGQADAAWTRVAQLWDPLADDYGHPRVSAHDL